ncbi:penicillin acylase family protein [Streptomyces sp. NBC_00257]|uniref:penicillin acylase family protein n=1 Tax=unclassified Streptomyces TaxID=2593676 RepID=UPI000F5BEEDF|nr:MULTISPECIES: penicillin acylase family protein [unclassified Streptomyces]WSX02013.1 penicillin acylase family protein [Streptomyces sp. NBC_00987]WTB54856.1 penicillin acylase family protein [Streptomyces sp. NBC_00826]WTH92258.1 penicillin acylase family protein [Streptomyces sp. NBC_00825]WTI00987.1 penicillin acylase family protein [Streptomyces sp. NBC_00822]MCX4396079.1 penicillin acylase family protein [Streptomyces sp. NBC_01767]
MPANTTASSGSTGATGSAGAKTGRKKGRRARLIVIVLVLALVAGIGYGAFWSVSTVRASYPQTTGSTKLDGLDGNVDVKRDSYGIPQLYADTDADLFRAQGFVQAQDRFWEMDVRRHMTAGRLSEMFGSGQVETDSFLRTLGWRKVAQEEYDNVLSEETKKNLQAYADGVNAYLKGRDGKDISVEYAALGFTNDYKPTEWTPVDSVAWLKAMAWDLRGNMQDEIDRSLMASRLDAKQIEDLYPPYPYEKHRPIVDQGAVSPVTGKFDPDATPSDNIGSDTAQGATEGLNTQLSSLSDTLDQIPALLGPNGNGIGSNSWVVSGDYTTTGKPLLANDPHLAPQLPSLWYQMGLHCREISAKCQYDTAGYTFSGMPGVIIGHNQDIAWGFTNLGADVTDLFLEKVSGDGYLYDGKVKPFTVRDEVIKVAGGKDRTITVRETNNGPLVSDRSSEMEKVGQKAPVTNAAPDRADGYAVALKWTALEPGKSMDAVFELNRAKDFKTFRAAAEHFEVPSQNLIYADTDGHIGYQAPGKIPVRLKGDGTMPSPGWSSKYGWEKDPIPFDELPYEYDPKRGYIVTANQAVIDEKKYSHLLTKDWGYGSRSQRIDDLIQSKIKGGGKISTEDMQKMQMDNTSEIAALLVPELMKINVSDKSVREAQKLLEGWDYTQEPDSAAAAYFNAVWRNILKLAFGNKLPKELRVEGECLNVPRAAGSGPVDEQHRLVRECGQRAADSAQPDGGDRWYQVVADLMDDQNSDWWKAPKSGRDEATENRDQLFARAMEDARWELTAKLGKDITTWSWGRLHQLTLKNQTLGTEGPGLLQRALNRGPWNLGGGEAAVNATGWNAAGGYEVVWVPSMRMVVNVGDWDKSRWINLTGASGHAFSAHYTDQTDKWVNGELLDWSFGTNAVGKSTTDTLTLKP